MRFHRFRNLFILSVSAAVSFVLTGCGPQPGVSNVNLTNSGSNISPHTVNANAANNNTATSAAVVAKEPTAYQATVTLKLESVGGQQNIVLPTLSANVARSGNDRRMEFAMPAGATVVFLDKAGTNYLILPEKKQYATLDRDSLGFDVRRMLMPEQIVDQVKNAQGMERIGEEKYNGRNVTKYRYNTVADTQTKAGQVATDSFLLVDTETGLPLRSETVSQSQSGGNVQGYNGIRIITEISDIKTETPTELFAEPTAFQKVESEQVRSQVNVIFNSLAVLLSQMMKQGQPSNVPMASPAR